MKRLFLALVTLALSFGFAVEESEARRFGGGSSFGMQRSAPAVAPKAAPSAPAPSTPGATPPRRGLMGPIAGLAAGLGLAALFSSLGIGEEMASLLLIALMGFAAFALFRWITRPAAQLAPAGATGRMAMAPMPSSSAAPSAAARPDFDEAGFLRQAKLNFVRLQAAYDVGNLDDIRSFTAPEVFAEIRMQYEERDGAAQQTDVIDLTAELIELAEETGQYIASVRFSGLIREASDTPPANFDEIWHLTKPVDGTRGWLVAGIQQTH